jgi:DNA repair protein RadC
MEALEIFFGKDLNKVLAIAGTSLSDPYCLVSLLTVGFERQSKKHQKTIKALRQSVTEFQYDTKSLNCRLNRELAAYSWEPREQFFVCSISDKEEIIAVDRVSMGDRTSCAADPMIIFRTALARGASSLVVAHNHPSGVLTPSADDISLTNSLIKAGNHMGIPITGHLIIGMGDFRPILIIEETGNAVYS